MSAPRRAARRPLLGLLVAVLVAACSGPAPTADSSAELTPWGPCPQQESHDSPPDSSGAVVDVECATITVPFDYARPHGDTFTIPVVRIPSKAEKPRLLITNPGGPGIGGADDLRANSDYFAKFVDTYTVVSFDPRGVAGSQPAIRCLGEQQRSAIFDQPSVPTSDYEIAHALELARGIGASCERQFGDALPHLGTANVARDIDAVCQAMGFEQISYLGYSYGTFVGAVYADMFPGKTYRIVLDSAMDPALNYQEIRHGQARGMQRSVTEFVEDFLEQPQCPLSGPRDTALQQISDLIDGLNNQPYTGADGGQLSGARMLALVESSQYFPESGWPSLRENLARALAHDWTPVMEAAYSPDLMVNPADSEYLSVACLDFQTERNPADPRRLAEAWASENPITGGSRAWSLAPCETWPAASDRDPQPVRAEGAGPALILNTAGDPATPLAWAQSLHQQLATSTLVIAPENGHIASTQNACAEDTLTEFLMRGVLPADPVFTCPANP